MGKNPYLLLGSLVLIFSIVLYWGLGLGALSPLSVPSTPAGLETPLPIETRTPESRAPRCPVCGQAVNPETAAHQVTFKGKTLFFDRYQCFEEFNLNPIKYLDVKLKVKIQVESAPEESPQVIEELPLQESPEGLESSPSLLEEPIIKEEDRENLEEIPLPQENSDQ